MFKILSAIRQKPTTVNYQQLMIEFLTGIVQGVRAELDPFKQDWKYWCIEEILLEHRQFMEGGQAHCIGTPQRCYENCLNMIFTPENPKN